MLPKNVKPTGTFNITRLGKNNDGGYLVEKSSIKATDILISFGLNDDWSFEKAFTSERDVKVEAYNHTVSEGVFVGVLLQR